jgi:hypothetical protein
VCKPNPPLQATTKGAPRLTGKTFGLREDSLYDKRDYHASSM